MVNTQTNEFKLEVTRNLSDRKEELSGDLSKKLALELHQKRAKILHDIFDNSKSFKVLDWQDTDDSQPHEAVTITFIYLSTVLAPLGWEIIKFIGEKLLDKGFDEVASTVVKNIFQLLLPKQKDKEIADIKITLPSGFAINIQPQTGVKVNIFFLQNNIVKEVINIEYDSNKAE
jgi:hypothetical protein